MTELEYFLLVQGIGILVPILNAIAFQCRSHTKLMCFRTCNEALSGMQYLLLGAYTGAFLNFASIVRNLLFAFQIKKEKSTRLTQLFFCLLFTASAAYTFAGLTSLVALVGKLLSTIAFGMKNQKHMRYITLVMSACWIFYNSVFFSLGGLIAEAMTVTSTLISLWRFYRKPLPLASTAEAEQPTESKEIE